MQELESSVPHTPVSYRGRTKSGIDWRIDLVSGVPAVGETIRGAVSFDGDQAPPHGALTAELVALGLRPSTSFDLTGLAADAMGVADEEGEREDVRMTDKVVTTPLVTLSAPIHSAPDGGRLVFDIQIPTDAPPSIPARFQSVAWRLLIKFDTANGAEAVRIDDLPVVLKASRVAGTPNLQQGALDRTVTGSTKGLDWSMEIESLPLVPGQRYRGTLVVAVTDKLRTVRPDVHLEEGVFRIAKSYTLHEWREAGTVIEDGFDETGRRRIVFEGAVPTKAFATANAGDVAFVASIGVSFIRWGLFGPDLKRPVAVASAA